MTRKNFIEEIIETGKDYVYIITEQGNPEEPCIAPAKRYIQSYDLDKETVLLSEYKDGKYARAFSIKSLLATEDDALEACSKIY